MQGTVLCGVSPASVIGNRPYVLVVPDHQPGPKLELLAIHVDNKQTWSQLKLRPFTASNEYIAKVSELCTDDLLRATIKSINPDRWSKQHLIADPRGRPRARRPPQSDPDTSARAAAETAYQSNSLQDVWAVYKIADERLTTALLKLSTAEGENKSLRAALATAKGDACKLVAAHQKDITKREKQFASLEGKNVKLNDKINETQSCKKCANLKKDHASLQRQLKQVELQLQEAEEIQDTAPLRVRTCKRAKVPPPTPSEDCVAEILVKERDKNDILTLALTKQIGETFAQIMASVQTDK